MFNLGPLMLLFSLGLLAYGLSLNSELIAFLAVILMIIAAAIADAS